MASVVGLNSGLPHHPLQPAVDEYGTIEVTYEDRPEEEPLLTTGHPDQRLSRTITSDGHSVNGHEAMGDNEMKAKKIMDQTYESIWMRGEMLSSYKKNKLNQSATMDQPQGHEHIDLQATSFSSGNEQGEHQRPSAVKPSPATTVTAKSKPRACPLDENEYSQYWRGEVTIIKPKDLQNATTFTGLQPTSILKVSPVRQSLNCLDKSMSESAITQAIASANSQLLLECIKQGEFFKRVCSKTGRTYLHVVTQCCSPDNEVKFVPMIYQLSNAGIDLDLRDHTGATAVGVAISRKLSQLMAALLKCGAEFTEDDLYNLEQMKGVAQSEMMELARRLTPSYWVAVHDPTPFKVHRLVKSWSRVNVSRNNVTLIEYAKKNVNNDSIVRLLLKNEASIELAHAVMAGDPDMTKVLLCHSDVDLDTRDASVKNNFFEPFAPLSLVGAAIKYDHANVLKMLRNANLRRKSWDPQRAMAYDVENRVAGGDSSLFVKGGHSFDGNAVTVFHYNASGRDAYDYQPPEMLTSTVCDIL